ncbi:hypothetical protein ACHQM5_019361 [Ranunculus cassubicifolius]
MNPKTLATSALAITTLLLLLPTPGSAITCTDVVKDLSPCIKYLVNGGSPSTACCAGATNLMNSASTSADKKTACTCIQSTAAKVKVNSAAAQALPGSCGITLPFTVSASVDCSK